MSVSLTWTARNAHQRLFSSLEAPPHRLHASLHRPRLLLLSAQPWPLASHGQARQRGTRRRHSTSQSPSRRRRLGLLGARVGRSTSFPTAAGSTYGRVTRATKAPAPCIRRPAMGVGARHEAKSARPQGVWTSARRLCRDSVPHDAATFHARLPLKCTLLRS